ncbi:MAG TPA: quinolinate synthase NadA [Armatimonadota bacterium]
MTDLPIQQPLPREYLQLDAQELGDRITAARKRLGDELVVLGHHYQRDEVIRHADFRGDSLKLARLASQRGQARYIVFCGVHFMAESADILSQPHQQVILPNLTAGCSMADMADIYQVEECWEQLAAVTSRRILPVTYINSAASLKAFVGRNRGAVCTSSNARPVLEWALSQGDKVLFFPDQHLGRNTALGMGHTLDEMLLWDPEEPFGGHTAQAIEAAQFLLWKGHCSVHARFTVDQIAQAREQFPGIRVIVHPECSMEVVQAADDSGSTERIIQQVTRSEPGSKWAIGTEINLVSRLAHEQPGKTIFCLDPIVCPCSTMYRIHPAYLLWVLDNLLEGRVVNHIQVPGEVASWAKRALDRMLEIC